jgi:hypothetical protein
MTGGEGEGEEEEEEEEDDDSAAVTTVLNPSMCHRVLYEGAGIHSPSDAPNNFPIAVPPTTQKSPGNLNA